VILTKLVTILKGTADKIENKPLLCYF